jgi:hypothetical protein
LRRTSTGDAEETTIEQETEDTEQAIRERAYHLWLEAGQPEHQHEEHWHRARQIIEASNDEPKPD